MYDDRMVVNAACCSDPRHLCDACTITALQAFEADTLPLPPTLNEMIEVENRERQQRAAKRKRMPWEPRPTVNAKPPKEPAPREVYDGDVLPLPAMNF